MNHDFHEQGWTCDSCGGLISDVEEGWVEWIDYTDESGNRKGRDLRLVHHNAIDSENTQCQFDSARERAKDGGSISDLPLKCFLGPDGLTALLAMIAEDELPKEMVIEMICRLHVPGYERARPFMDKAIAEGIISLDRPRGLYSQNQVKTILQEYAVPDDEAWPE